MPSRSPTRRRLLAAGATGLTVGVAGCLSAGDFASTASSTRTIPADDARSLAVHNENGPIAASAWEEDAVELAVTKRALFDSGAFDRATVSTSVSDGVLAVRTEDTSGLLQRRATVDVRVRVPGDWTVRTLETDNGDVDVRDVAGDLGAASHNGNVRVRHVDGYVSLETDNGNVESVGCRGVDGAHTSNGDVDVEVRSLRRDATFDSANGNVVLRLDPDLDADYRAETANGEVRVVGLDATDRVEGTGSASGRLGDGGPTLTATTSNGDVELRSR